MTLDIIFAISGISVATLLSAKVWEGKSRQKPLLLRLISRGDERVRSLSHRLADRYSEHKEKTLFFINRQLPLHARNAANKAQAAIRERAQRHLGDIRGSRFLKKSDGLSEFFKNISDREEEGRIDDTLE